MKQQTKAHKQDPEQSFANRSKSANNEGRLLLLCDGACRIVFAHGDQSIFQTKMQNLKHRNLFELGFSQHSLRKLVHQAEGGLLQVPRRFRKFSLDLVKPLAKCSEDVFYRNIHIYLSKLQLSCSLTRVKFSKKPIQQRICEVKRLPLTLMDKVEDEIFLTLVEIVEEPLMYFSNTTYEDYCLTLQKLQETKDQKREEAKMAMEMELEIEREEPRVKIEEW